VDEDMGGEMLESGALGPGPVVEDDAPVSAPPVEVVARAEGEREKAAFDLSVMRNEPQGPGLDPVMSRSPLALYLRENAVDEDMIAKEVARGLRDSRPGKGHLEYLRLARELLGYRDKAQEAAGQRDAGMGLLAASVASALAQARSSGVVPVPDTTERPKKIKSLGAEIL
jgi:hypothetical protein